jgi:hypothetical protein
MASVLKSLVLGVQLQDSVTAHYTAPASTTTRIDKATVCNDDSSTITISVYLVPSGGSAAPANRVIKDKAIRAGETRSLGLELSGHVLPPGASLQAVASTVDEVSLQVSGSEMT